MKKYGLVFLFSLMFSSVLAQQDSLPVYKRFPTIPPFSITRLPDSSAFKKENLKKKKNTLIIIFSPDCHHCVDATKDMLANAALFKSTQILMVSSMPYQDIKNFYVEYEIAQQHNIIMGWDAGYFLGTFYRITNYPSIFLYDKKGNLVKDFEGSTPFKTIAEAL